MSLLGGETFEQRALTLFRHQYEGIAAYRTYCDGRGVTPDNCASWLDIPAVPTDVFKHVRLSTSDESVRTFRTSGTTQGARGEHHFATLDHYREAIHPPFRHYCMPDHARMPMAILAASPGEATDSSLSFMLGELIARYGHPLSSGFFVARDEQGELGFDWDGLIDMLDRASMPIMLLGTAFAFVQFFDDIDMTWQLPVGSRVMETGGLKGRSREVTREELYGMFETRLGVAPTHCIAEYSMTELSSQAYTDPLSRNVPWRDARFRTPEWARVIAVDPETLTPLSPGTRGLLRWVDLANVDSICAVQTSDVGIVDEDGGFQLFGRAQGAELRGCSLAIEELTE